MYKQVIIVRKDLNMSHGKMAAQVSHASMAFLSHMIKNNTEKQLLPDMKKCHAGDPETETVTLYRHPDLWECAKKAISDGRSEFFIKEHNCDFTEIPEEEAFGYVCQMSVDSEMFKKWICGTFTKVILQAKNKGQLMKAEEMAKELGMKENVDYFMIRDNCYTELIPEENGRTLTCIGFRPMDSEMIDQIGKKFHLYQD